MDAIYEPTGKAREFGDLACNLYRGCSHGCVYCYAPGVLRMSREEFSTPNPREGILEQLARDAEKHAGSRTPILLSFTSDPYQPLEPDMDITRAALEILADNGCAINVLTKGGDRACRDFDILASDLGNWFGTTLTFFDGEDSCNEEPCAASPYNRIEAIEEAKRRGINTWVSLEPIVDGVDALSLIIETMPFVDLYKIGKMNHRKGISDEKLMDFLVDATTILKANNKDYYIKLDTRPFLG